MVAMKSLSMLIVFAVLGTGLLPPGAHGAVRNCGKEIETDYKKYKRDMVRKGFSERVNTIKNPNFEKYLERRHAEVVKHEKAHANVAGKWGKKIIYKKVVYWGKKYAVAGCVPIRNLIPAKIAAAAALAPDKPSDVDLKIAKDAMQAIKYEKDYRKVKSDSKKCEKVFAMSKKAKCRKTYKKRLSGHPFLAVKSQYTW